MKRIIYISKMTNPLSNKEIESIGDNASQNNKLVDITGTLVFFEKMFFQIIEGEDKEVDRLFEKIGNDPRHYGVLKLTAEGKAFLKVYF